VWPDAARKKMAKRQAKARMEDVPREKDVMLLISYSLKVVVK
jgi:hypothetical protein